MGRRWTGALMVVACLGIVACTNEPVVQAQMPTSTTSAATSQSDTGPASIVTSGATIDPVQHDGDTTLEWSPKWQTIEFPLDGPVAWRGRLVQVGNREYGVQDDDGRWITHRLPGALGSERSPFVDSLDGTLLLRTTSIGEAGEWERSIWRLDDSTFQAVEKLALPMPEEASTEFYSWQGRSDVTWVDDRLLAVSSHQYKPDLDAILRDASLIGNDEFICSRGGSEWADYLRIAALPREPNCDRSARSLRVDSDEVAISREEFASIFGNGDGDISQTPIEHRLVAWERSNAGEWIALAASSDGDFLTVSAVRATELGPVALLTAEGSLDSYSLRPSSTTADRAWVREPLPNSPVALSSGQFMFQNDIAAGYLIQGEEAAVIVPVEFGATHILRAFEGRSVGVLARGGDTNWYSPDGLRWAEIDHRSIPNFDPEEYRSPKFEILGERLLATLYKRVDSSNAEPIHFVADLPASLDS